MILSLRQVVSVAATCVLLSAFGNTADAGLVFGVSGAGGGASVLYKIDQTNGSVIQTVGATGFIHVTGLAFDPTNGQLYGHVSDLFGSGKTQLVKIDVNTGAGTLVGDTGLQAPDMTFDSTGQLYAWGESSATVLQNDDLYSINKTTGAATWVGESGLDTAMTGLGFDNSDTLYLTRYGTELFSVDKLTGATTFQTSLSSSVNNALTFDPLTNQAYSVVRRSGSSFLQQIDVSTGTVTELGNIGISGISALAFQPPTAVPEPSSLVIACMGAIGFGLFRRRRRQEQTT